MRGLIMKNPIKGNRTVAHSPAIYYGVDSHKWAHKMEVQRLVSSKPKVLAKLRKRHAGIF